jgi:hypothetical protein
MQYISSYQTGSVGPILNIQTPQAILLIYAVWQVIKRVVHSVSLFTDDIRLLSSCRTIV